MTEPTAPASPTRPGSSAPPPSPSVPGNATDALLPAADKGASAPAKCLGLFVILSIVYFWNTYCLSTVVPKVARLLDEAGIELNDHQQKFVTMSTMLSEERMLAAIPIGVIVALGLVALASRYWSLFGGVFFSLIVALFLLFLYGWLVFAVPLIQIQKLPPTPDSAATGSAAAPMGSGS